MVVEIVAVAVCCCCSCCCHVHFAAAPAQEKKCFRVRPLVTLIGSLYGNALKGTLDCAAVLVAQLAAHASFEVSMRAGGFFLSYLSTTDT